MRNVLWHQPMIQRALFSYDARREFGEKERSVRSARFSQDEMQRPKF